MIRGRAVVATLVALSLLASAVGPGVVAADVRGSPDISAVASDNRLTPGEETHFTVTLLNTGVIENGSARNPGAEQRVTTARGTTVELGSGDAPVTVRSGPVGIGSIPDGAAVPASFSLSVDEGAEPGTYTLPVTVNYTHTSEISNNSETHVNETVERTLEVEVVVERSPRFEVVDASTTAAVGGSGTVALRVENVGREAARDASVTLQSRNGALTFAGTPTAETYVGKWAPGETRLLTYEARVAPGTERRELALGATVAYEDGDGVPGRATLSTGVTPLAEQTFAVESVNASVAPGSSGLLTLSLTNTGNGSLSDAAVTVRSPNSVLTFGGTPTAEAYVGEWTPGETREVPVEARLAEGAPVRNYAVEVSVSYTDAAGNEGQSGRVLAGARPAPEQSFDLTDVRGTLRVGTEGTLSATLVNEGPSVARNAVLVLGGTGRNANVGETEYAVGDLAPGESTTVQYDVEMSSAASEGPRQFQFHLEYRDRADDSRRSDPLYLRTDVAPEQPTFTVEPVEAEVGAGSTATFRVDVTNTRNETLRDVSAKLFTNAPLDSGDDEAFVTALEPGETATLTFKLSAAGGATAKTYPVSLDFQYDDSDGDTLVSDTYRVPVEVRERSGGGGVLSFAPVGIGVGVLALALGAFVVVRRRR